MYLRLLLIVSLHTHSNALQKTDRITSSWCVWKPVMLTIVLGSCWLARLRWATATRMRICNTYFTHFLSSSSDGGYFSKNRCPRQRCESTVIIYLLSMLCKNVPPSPPPFNIIKFVWFVPEFCTTHKHVSHWLFHLMAQTYIIYIYSMRSSHILQRQ